MLRIISLEDIELNVYDAGEGDPIVFVHGFPLDHTMWMAQLEEFSQTHRVIAPDLRGFGQSEDSPGIVPMEQFADDLSGILSQLHVTMPVTLCGLSMGGYIAWQFWKRHPQQLRRLILCDTRAVEDSPEAKQNRQQTSEQVLNHGASQLAETMPGKMFSLQTNESQPELIDQVKSTILRTSPMGISAALLGMAARPDVTSWLPQIRVPSLVIVGEDDTISTVQEMEAIAAALPVAEFQVIPQAGHLSPLEQPGIVNQTIHQFLARH